MITKLFLSILILNCGYLVIFCGNTNLLNLPIVSRNYKRFIEHKWSIFIERLFHLCLKKMSANFDLIDLERKIIYCLIPNLMIDNFNRKVNCALSGKKMTKPFGYLCIEGRQDHGFLHRFDFGAKIFVKKNVVKLSSNTWYIVIAGNKIFGLNMTFLQFSLTNVDPGYYPMFEMYELTNVMAYKAFATFSTCKLEFVYIDFYRQNDFKHSYYHSFGPYCGYRSPWTLFSTGNAKIYLRTFEKSPSFFIMHYQAIGLGYVVTTSARHENAVWLHDKTEQTEMNILVLNENTDYIRAEEIHGGWMYGRFNNLFE